MPSTIELRKNRAGLVEKAREIANAAETESRDMSAEEKETFDKLLGEVETLKNRIDSLEKLETVTEDFAEENSRSRLVPRAEQRAESRNESRAVEGSKEYRKAFLKYIETGETRELRDLSVSTANKGGFLIAPLQLAEGVYKALDERSFMRQLARVHKVRDAVALGIRKITARATDADWKTENEIDTFADMTFGRRELKPNRLSKIIKVSLHLLETSQDSEQIIVEEMVQANNRPEHKAFMVGDGDGEPLGIFTVSADGISTGRDVVAGSTTAVTAAGLFAAKFALDQEYLRSPSARWVMNSAVLSKIATLVDSVGVPLWQPSLQLGTPDKLLGIPVETSSYAPATFTTGLYMYVLGDFAGYHIADTAEISVQRLEEKYIEYDLIGFRSRRYSDGAPIVESGFVRGKLA